MSNEEFIAEARSVATHGGASEAQKLLGSALDRLEAAEARIAELSTWKGRATPLLRELQEKRRDYHKVYSRDVIEELLRGET